MKPSAAMPVNDEQPSTSRKSARLAVMPTKYYDKKASSSQPKRIPIKKTRSTRTALSQRNGGIVKAKAKKVKITAGMRKMAKWYWRGSGRGEKPFFHVHTPSDDYTTSDDSDHEVAKERAQRKIHLQNMMKLNFVRDIHAANNGVGVLHLVGPTGKPIDQVCNVLLADNTMQAAGILPAFGKKYVPENTFHKLHLICSRAYEHVSPDVMWNYVERLYQEQVHWCNTSDRVRWTHSEYGWKNFTIDQLLADQAKLDNLLARHRNDWARGSVGQDKKGWPTSMLDGDMNEILSDPDQVDRIDRKVAPGQRYPMHVGHPQMAWKQVSLPRRAGDPPNGRRPIGPLCIAAYERRERRRANAACCQVLKSAQPVKNKKLARRQIDIVETAADAEAESEESEEEESDNDVFIKKESSPEYEWAPRTHAVKPLPEPHPEDPEGEFFGYPEQEFAGKEQPQEEQYQGEHLG